MRDQEMVCLENEKLIKKVEECEQFHSFGGKSKVSDLVRHRKNGSNTSLPEMINNNNFKQVHYDSSSAVSHFNLYLPCFLMIPLGLLKAIPRLLSLIMKAFHP